MDLDKIITTLCTIICTVIAILTYTDNRKKQLNQNQGEQPSPQYLNPSYHNEKEKSKNFSINNSYGCVIGSMESDNLIMGSNVVFNGYYS